jgi:hypothetical protein
VITSNALGNQDVPSASDRIVMVGIGLGSQGSNDQADFFRRVRQFNNCFASQWKIVN